MKRPIYENQKTITKEGGFKESIELSTGYKLVKMPRAYEVDFAMLEGSSWYGRDYVGCAELKCRSCASTTYETLILSLHKLDALKRWRQYGSSFLCVRYSDADLVLPIDDSLKLSIRFAGRTDRGDWQDLEPCVHIPVSLMSPVDRYTHDDRLLFGDP